MSKRYGDPDEPMHTEFRRDLYQEAVAIIEQRSAHAAGEDTDLQQRCPICGDSIDYCLGHGVANSQEKCDVCGEHFTGSVHEEIAEMYNPTGEEPHAHVICHAQCGIDHNLEIA